MKQTTNDPHSWKRRTLILLKINEQLKRTLEGDIEIIITYQSNSC